VAWYKNRARIRARTRGGGIGGAPPIINNTLLYQDGIMAKYQDGTIIELQRA